MSSQELVATVVGLVPTSQQQGIPASAGTRVCACVRMCVCVRVHACVHMCMPVCTRLYARAHVYVHVCVRTHVRVCTHVCACVRTCLLRAALWDLCSAGLGKRGWEVRCWPSLCKALVSDCSLEKDGKSGKLGRAISPSMPQSTCLGGAEADELGRCEGGWQAQPRARAQRQSWSRCSRAGQSSGKATGSRRSRSKCSSLNAGAF